eukprot:g13806.t1
MCDRDEVWVSKLSCFLRIIRVCVSGPVPDCRVSQGFVWLAANANILLEDLLEVRVPGSGLEQPVARPFGPAAPADYHGLALPLAASPACPLARGNPPQREGGSLDFPGLRRRQLWRWVPSGIREAAGGHRRRRRGEGVRQGPQLLVEVAGEDGLAAGLEHRVC